MPNSRALGLGCQAQAAGTSNFAIGCIGVGEGGGSNFPYDTNLIRFGSRADQNQDCRRILRLGWLEHIPPPPPQPHTHTAFTHAPIQIPAPVTGF